MRALAEQVKFPIEMHCHNDLNLAVANSISGAAAVIEAGQDAWINVTVNGMGERAGNADLMSVLLAISYGCNLADALPLGGNVDLRWATACHATSPKLRQKIPINQPFVGANASPTSQGSTPMERLKDRHNYELFDFDALGGQSFELRPHGRIITTGEYGGLAGLKHVYSELGIELSDEQARVNLELVQLANAHNQAPLQADELRFIARYPAQAARLLTVVPSEAAAQLVEQHARPEWSLPWELPSGVKPLTLEAIKLNNGAARLQERKTILFE